MSLLVWANSGRAAMRRNAVFMQPPLIPVILTLSETKRKDLVLRTGDPSPSMRLRMTERNLFDLLQLRPRALQREAARLPDPEQREVLLHHGVRVADLRHGDDHLELLFDRLA